ncbi:MAG: hypothetical protein ABSE59_03260 [Opitutaceae bacterium]|jgi:hypothetical protein
MNTSLKTQPSPRPLFAADFGSRRRFSAWIDADVAPAARSLGPVMPRVRDNLALRCVFSRTADLFASEPSHARRAH